VAAKGGQEEVVAALLAHGAEVNRTTAGTSTLILAVVSGHAGVAILKEHGAKE
jgi:hypothetical protein